MQRDGVMKILVVSLLGWCSSGSIHSKQSLELYSLSILVHNESFALYQIKGVLCSGLNAFIQV